MSDVRLAQYVEHAATASKILFRANVYFESWWKSAGVEGRREFKDFWNEHWEFWRFNEHAMQFAFVVYTAGLYERRSDTVNFGTLWAEAQPYSSESSRTEFDHIWHLTKPTAKSLIILRSNAMAHRSMALNYRDAFKKANVTPDQLRELLCNSWKLLNIVEISLSQRPTAFDPIAIETLRRLVSTRMHREPPE